MDQTKKETEQLSCRKMVCRAACRAVLIRRTRDQCGHSQGVRTGPISRETAEMGRDLRRSYFSKRISLDLVLITVVLSLLGRIPLPFIHGIPIERPLLVARSSSRSLLLSCLVSYHSYQYPDLSCHTFGLFYCHRTEQLTEGRGLAWLGVLKS